MSRNRKSSRKIRYAVVGVGHLTQVALLPVFNKAENSELVAQVSGDAEKQDEVGKKAWQTLELCAPHMNR
jgi:predicted dehydrogenase